MASCYFRENKYFVVISPIPSHYLAKMNILLPILGRESTCHVSFQCRFRIEYRSMWKPNWALVWKCSFNKRIAGTSLIAFTVDGCLSLALAYIFSILRFFEMVKQSRDIWCLMADQINLGTLVVWTYLLHITINIPDFPLSLLEQEDKCGILKNKEALLRNLFKSTGNAWMKEKEERWRARIDVFCTPPLHSALHPNPCWYWSLPPLFCKAECISAFHIWTAWWPYFSNFVKESTNDHWWSAFLQVTMIKLITG